MDVLIHNSLLFKARSLALPTKAYYMEFPLFNVYFECKCLGTDTTIKNSTTDRNFQCFFSCPWFVIWHGPTAETWETISDIITTCIFQKLLEWNNNCCGSWLLIMPNMASISVQLVKSNNLENCDRATRVNSLHFMQLDMATFTATSSVTHECTRVDANNKSILYSIYSQWIDAFAPDVVSQHNLPLIKPSTARFVKELIQKRSGRHQYYYEQAHSLCFLIPNNRVRIYYSYEQHLEPKAALLLLLDETYQSASIWYLTTAKLYRGQNYAKSLVNFALADTKSGFPQLKYTNLMCRDDLIKFYEKLGFVQKEPIIETFQLQILFKPYERFKFLKVNS